MNARWRLAYLVSHPIQYQAPLLRLIAAQPDIDLKVFFCSDLSVREYHDEGFGQAVRWDIPLLEDYPHEFLPALTRTDRLTFWRPLNYGLARRLREGDFDALWIHGWGYWSHVRAVTDAKKLGIKVLLRGESGVHLGSTGWVKRFLRRLLMRHLVRKTDAFLTIGENNREYYLRYGASPQQLFRVPYCVDNDFFQKQVAAVTPGREALRGTLGLEPGRPVILFASKMIERKRPGDLLEAYMRLSPDGNGEPRPYLLFVGDGELRSELESRSARTGWRSIRFLGFKNQTELPAFYDLCDLFVLPSVQEPWGLVINEVMNAARAVIVSDEVGCARDLVQSGVNGKIFQAGDIDALHQALAGLISDPGKLREQGKKSLEIILRWSFREDVAGLREALERVTVLA